MSAMYTHLRAAVSVGKWPRAFTALRMRAFTDSIALVSGMKEGRHSLVPAAARQPSMGWAGGEVWCDHPGQGVSVEERNRAGRSIRWAESPC